MKKLIALAVFTVWMSGCQSIQALDERISERIRRSSWLKETTIAVLSTTEMRSGPGAEYPILRTLQKGQQVVPLGTADGWRAVRLGTESGFVRLEDLEPTERP